ncbi:MAG: T9SS type B sorting domain-containing protein, partial [Sphingobacteriales bacterium]
DISPTHEFSSPGIYNVSLVASNASGVTSTATKEVVIIGAGKQTNWPGACTNAPDATLTILATGSNTPYFYSWDTNPAQSTASISNVSAGTYRVFVSAVNACSLQDSFVLVASTAININPVVKNANCTAANGSITTAVSGGAAPYQYLWSNGFTTSSIGSLSPGNYSLTITDANNCVTSAGPYNIVKDDRALAVSLGNNRNICPGQSITLAPGNFSAYLWQDGSTGPNLLATAPGVYSVTVTDGSGCTGQANVTLTGDCSDIYFPSAFTPNADTRNDLFGPLGNVYNISAYSLNVYDRYGNRVFASSDPFRKWDGTYKSAKPNTGAFVWTSQFTLNGIVQYRKGTVTLLR